MARKPMVTRTILSTKATVLCLNTVTAEPETQVYVAPRTYKTDKDLLKALKKVYETEDFVLAQITSTEVVEERYGMTEAEFIKAATVLPKVEKKENE